MMWIRSLENSAVLIPLMIPSRIWIQSEQQLLRHKLTQKDKKELQLVQSRNLGQMKVHVLSELTFTQLRESGTMALVGDSEALTAMFYKRHKLSPRGNGLYQQCSCLLTLCRDNTFLSKTDSKSNNFYITAIRWTMEKC